LNNNRNTNNNRRRGRNNNRPQGGGGGGAGNQLNRIDSRSRGNAPQMLDKYKKLAQDAQHNGDRVQQETFLQYADHYFRVINDNKVRQDEARAKRDDQNDGPNSNQGDDSQNQRDSQSPRDQGPRDQGQRDQGQRDQGQRDSQDQRDDDDNRRPRRSRSRRDEGDAREIGRDDGRNEGRGNSARGNAGHSANGQSHDDNRGQGNGHARDNDDDSPSDDFSDAPAPKVRAKVERAPRKPRVPKPAVSDQGEIDIAVLPPAIGRSSDDEPVKKKPALRPRRKRTDDSEAVG
jgi:hypothetical protein